MTGKKNDSHPTLNKQQVEALRRELAMHEEAAARLELQGNTGTYHHERAAQIRVELESEDDNGKLDE